jgi:hypothetical protein
MVVVAPLLITQLQWIGHIIKCWWLYSIKRQKLNLRQFFSSIFYFASLVLGIASEIVICSDEVYLSQAHPASRQPHIELGIMPKLLWLLAGVLFTLSIKLVIWNEIELLLQTKGYINPQPLCRTEAGWESGNEYATRTSTSILLGTIEITPASGLRIESLFLSDHPVALTADSINVV